MGMFSMANKNKRGFCLEEEIRNHFKNNLPVAVIVTACSFAGRRGQTFAFGNEAVTSESSQG